MYIQITDERVIALERACMEIKVSSARLSAFANPPRARRSDDRVSRSYGVRDASIRYKFTDDRFTQRVDQIGFYTRVSIFAIDIAVPRCSSARCASTTGVTRIAPRVRRARVIRERDRAARLHRESASSSIDGEESILGSP